MAENLVGNSTILEPAPGAMALGGGAPVIADIKDKGADDYKPQSVADVLTAEAKRLNEEEAAEQKAVKDKAAKASEDAKAKVAEKEQAEKDAETKAKADRARANDGKFAKAEKAESDDGDEAEQDGEQPEKADEQEQEKSRRPRTQEEIQRENEKRRYSVVAERFTPEARAKWDNVPHPVKAELFRLSQERDTEIQRYRQSHERYEQFRQLVREVSIELAQAVVRDGEGATKFITITVDGGRTREECRDVAYTIAHSPLVKTAFFASDPNWGRILAAVGRAG